MVSPEGEIARLEARVASLEAALLRRSRELRLLQASLCPRDLRTLERLAGDESSEPAFLEGSGEGHPDSVFETLGRVWKSPP